MQKTHGSQFKGNSLFFLKNFRNSASSSYYYCPVSLSQSAGADQQHVHFSFSVAALLKNSIFENLRGQAVDSVFDPWQVRDLTESDSL